MITVIDSISLLLMVDNTLVPVLLYPYLMGICKFTCVTSITGTAINDI
ncbi:hypothetical protein NXV87_06115 [Bacteroides fragilis]|nr:hypothetical protein [Bacteroides fragilis]